MITSVDQDLMITPPKTLRSSLSDWLRDTWFSTAVLFLMTATMIALFWFPMRRISTNVEVSYNEGWNAYRAAMVASKIPLYGVRPRGFGTGTAYPPISFHLIGNLGTTNTFVAVGRWVSLISLIATGIFVALIVRRGGGSSHVAVFSFLLYEIGIALLTPDRVGMNDPQLLGEAFSAAGLYFYVRNPQSKRSLCASALLLCLAGFTKHNLIAFPAAIAIDSFLRSRRAFITWAGAMFLSAGLLTAMTLWIDGRYFPLHLMGGGGKRAYSFAMAWSGYHLYAILFQSLLVIATAWIIYKFRSQRVIALAFVLTHVLAFLLAGGFGVGPNIFFNSLAVTVIACGLALSDMHLVVEAWRPAGLDWSATLMCGLFAVSIMAFVPGQLRRDRTKMRVLPAQQEEFTSAVQFMKLHPGPALCESHLLCYEAGKPFEYEPFSVRDQLKTGVLHEGDVLQLLKTHHFQTVQIALRADEGDLKDPELKASLSSDQTQPDTERRFTPTFMKELLEDYQLSKRTSEMAIFCPQ